MLVLDSCLQNGSVVEKPLDLPVWCVIHSTDKCLKFGLSEIEDTASLCLFLYIIVWDTKKSELLQRHCKRKRM